MAKLFENLPKPPKPPSLSKLLKETNPVREIIDDARGVIKGAREEISDIASALRVEEPEKPEKDEGESCPVCAGGLTDLKQFMERKKVEKALTELEAGATGESKKDVETVRKFIEGEDIA